MSFRPDDYLRHILMEAQFLMERCTGLDKQAFLADETLKRAVVRSLEVIGEATKQLDEATRSEMQDVEWRLIAGMRDRLIHGYFGVDYDIVWNVVMNKIPILRRAVADWLAAGSP